MLWARSSDLESRTLPGRSGEEARSDGQFDALAAMAAGRALARVSGPDLEPTGAASGKELRHSRDDHAGARRLSGRMGAADCGGGSSLAPRRDRRPGGYAQFSAYPLRYA